MPGPTLIRQSQLKPKLREIVNAADSSQWRKSLRAALDARDSSPLILLTTSDQFQDQPADLVAWLGSTLREGNEIDTSVALLQAAQQQHPGDFWLNYELGKSLDAKGEKLEALGYARAALAIRPDSQGTQMAVSNALRNSGQVEASNRMFKKILNNPKMTSNDFSSLGRGLELRRDVDRSIFCYQKAIELDPKNASAHNALGQALMAKGQVDQAIAEYRKAIELDPKHAWAHGNLGIALSAVNLPAFLKGEFEPSDNAERLGLADVCYAKKLYHTAVGLYVAAFAADPKLADDRQTLHAYNASCNAALASAGQGEDAIELDDADRTRLRQQALDWLTAEIGCWSKLLDSGPPKDRAVILQTLRHWQNDSDLASLRDAEALAKLPADEQTAFNQLWADVAALLKRAETPAATKAKP